MSGHITGEPPVLNLDDLIDNQRIGKPAIIFLFLAILAMIADGFDVAVMGYVGPELVKNWHIAAADLVPVLSAGIFGLLFGAPLFGMIGDRIGRKTGILCALSAFGVFSLLSTAATSLTELVILRFLASLGLGGLVPNIIALAAEIAPKRLRGMFVIIVNFGFPAGIALSGWVAALFVTNFGWHVLFLAGGVFPLLVGLLGFLFLQESPRYLLQRGDRQDQLRRQIQALRPELALDARACFVSPSYSAVSHSGSPARLFSGGLAIITPLLWIILAANQFTNFFTVSWLPLLLQSNGSSTAQAAVSASMFPVGGMVGGLVLLFIVDRFGALPIVILFALGAPVVAAIGIGNLSLAIIGGIIAAAGFCVTGNNFAINAVLGMIYPTSVRSTGSGWAQAFGRVGALGAQFAGGMLLARHLSPQEIFLAPAAALAVAAVASGVFVLLCFRKFGGLRIGDTTDPPDTPAQPDVTAMAP